MLPWCWVPKLTLIEFPAEFMVGAALDHLSDMLCFLVDWHGADDGTLRRGRHHLDLNGTRLGNLAVQLLQFCGVLKKNKQTEKWQRQRLMTRGGHPATSL